VCCHPGNSRETQITAICWGLAHAYRALFNLIQCSKGEGGGNEAAGTETGTAPPAGPAAPAAQQAVTAPPPTGTAAAVATGVIPASLAGTAAVPAPVPAAGIVAEPNDQPVQVAVTPVKLKKDAKRADRSRRDDNEPG